MVNDGSTDQTAEAVRSAANKSPGRIRVYHNATNMGGGVTRNRAVSLASTDLIYMVDADNVLGPDLAGRLIATVEASDCDIASPGQLRYFDARAGDFHAVRDLPHLNGKSGLRQLLGSEQGGPGNHGNYMYTRRSFEAAGGYPERHGALDTWAFGLAQLASGTSIRILADGYYFHRLRSDSYWMTQQREDGNRTEARAIATLKEYRHKMPPDLSAKVHVLRAEDPYFAALASGVFSELVSLSDFARMLERQRREAATKDPWLLRAGRRAYALTARIGAWPRAIARGR